MRSSAGAPMIQDSTTDRLGRLLDVSRLKAQVIAGNLANQNTPGYRTRAVAFDEAYRAALANGQDPLSVTPIVYEPRDTAVDVDGNDVAVDREVLAGAQNAFLYQTYVSILQGRNRLINTALTSAP